MARPQIAKAAAALERLDRQAVTLERLDVLAEKTRRLFEAGITYTEILARRNEVNALAERSQKVRSFIAEGTSN